MAKAPISLQFYPGDRLRELMPVLTDSEAIGAWCKAWMYLWGAGPSKPETVAQVAGKGWERVGFLFREENGLLSLEWMEEKRVETDAFKARQAANGRKGGRPKSTNSKKENPSLSNGLTQKEPKKSPRKEGEVEGEGGDNSEKEHTRKGPDPDVQGVVDYLLTRLRENDIAQDIAETKQDRRFAAHSIILAMRKRWPDLDALTNAKALIDAALANDFHRRHAMKLRYLLKHLDTIRLDAKARASNPKTQTANERQQHLADSLAKSFARRRAEAEGVGGGSE